MRRLAKIALLTIISLLVALALLSTSLRLTLPHINHWRTALLLHIARASGMPIEAGHLQAVWRNSGPVLNVYNLHIHLKNGDQLLVKQLSLQLDIWRSLLHARWQFQHLDFYQLNYQSDVPVNLQRSYNESDSEQHDGLRDLVFHQFRHFTLHDSMLNLLTETGQRVSLHIPQLTWLNSQQRHRAEGQISLSDLSGQQGIIRLRMDLHGDQRQPNSGTVWLQADNMDITPWLGRWIEQKTDKLKARASLQAWLQLKQGNIATGDIWLTNGQLDWQADHRTLTPHFTALQATQQPAAQTPLPIQPALTQHQLRLNDIKIHISPLDTGWQLAIAQTHISLDNQQWPTSALNIAWLPASNPSPADASQSAQTAQWRIRASQIDLQHITPLLSIPQTPLPFVRLWRQLQPRGQLDSLALDIPSGKPEQIRFQLHWHKLAWQAWRSLPAGEHLDGEISGSLASGQLSVRLRNATISNPHMFPVPFTVEQASASLGWKYGQQGLTLDGKKIVIRTPSLQFNGDFHYQHPRNAQPWLALLAGINLSDAKDAWRYFPYDPLTPYDPHNPHHLMSPHLAAYLRQAIQAGSVHNATLLFNGNPLHFPWPDNDGVFEARLPLRHGQFTFDHQWPPLHNLDLDLRFINDGLILQGTALQINQLQLHNLQVKIPHYHQYHLFIDGDIHGEADAVTRYFQKTPLHNSLAKTLESLPLSGNISGKLHLAIPLQKPDSLTEHASTSPQNEIHEVQASGEVHLSNNSLNITALNQQLSGLNGSFSFSNSELHGKNLSANWQGQPISLNFSASNASLSHSGKANPHPMAGNINQNWQITVEMAGNWRAGRIDALAPPLRQALAGTVRWQSKLNLSLPHSSPRSAASQPARLQRTDSASITAPARSSTDRPARQQQIRQKTQNNRPHYRLQITGDLNALTSRLPAPLDKTAGSALPFSLQATGDLQQFTLAGKLGSQTRFNSRWLLTPELTLERGILTSDHADTPPLPASASINLTLPASDGELLTILLQQGIADNLHKIRLLNVPLSIHTPQLDFAGESWKQASLSVQPLSDGKKFILQAKQINATLSQRRHHPWLAEITYLSYNPDSASSTLLSGLSDSATHNPLNEHMLNPANWPDIQFHCASCWLWGKNYGQISGTLQRHGDSVTLDHGRLDNDIASISLTGRWQRQGQHSHTAINGQLQGKKLDALTQFLTLGAPIQQSPFSLDYQLNWQDVPWQPDIASMGGTLHAHLDKGKIIDIDAGHAGQLLSLFSLDALLRRLRFDFRDNFSDGFYFNSIDSHATLHNGVLHTDDTLIKGLSADIAIQGNVDFPGNQLKLDTTVSPELASTVGVATAFAVNPLAGAAVYAASKVFSPLWNKISMLRYHISGSLEKPHISEILRQPRTAEGKPATSDASSAKKTAPQR